jgi:hypothetical protein
MANPTLCWSLWLLPKPKSQHLSKLQPLRRPLLLLPLLLPKSKPYLLATKAHFGGPFC